MCVFSLLPPSQRQGIIFILNKIAQNSKDRTPKFNISTYLPRNSLKDVVLNKSKKGKMNISLIYNACWYLF